MVYGMEQARHNLGTAKTIKAEALGEPGKRTFRILVEAENGTASIWMEKEQLSALAMSIKSHVDDTAKPVRQNVTMPAETASAEPSFDLKIANLALTFDEGTGRFGILAYDADDVEKQTATLIFWSPKAQAEEMAKQAIEIVASGRPTCPLCHRPMDNEGHACPNQNGHGTITGHL